MPIFQNKFVILMIGVIIGYLLSILFIKNNDSNRNTVEIIKNNIISDLALNPMTPNNPTPTNNIIYDNPTPTNNIMPDNIMPDNIIPDNIMPDNIMPNNIMPNNIMSENIIPKITEHFTNEFKEFNAALNQKESLNNNTELPLPYPDSGVNNAHILSNPNNLPRIMTTSGCMSSNAPMENNSFPDAYSCVSDEYDIVPSTRPLLNNVIKPLPLIINPTIIPNPNNNDDMYAPVLTSMQLPSQQQIQAQAQQQMQIQAQQQMQIQAQQQMQIQAQQQMQVPSQQNDSTHTIKPIQMYNYNASWCGWSKKFQPEWDNFTTIVKSDNTLNNMVDVKDIKCDDNNQICTDNNIDGYPTVVINVNGKSTIYNGPRTSDELMKTLKKIISTL